MHLIILFACTFPFIHSVETDHSMSTTPQFKRQGLKYLKHFSMGPHPSKSTRHQEKAALKTRNAHLQSYARQFYSHALVKRSDSLSPESKKIIETIDKEIAKFNKEIQKIETLLARLSNSMPDEDPEKSDHELWVEIRRHELQLNIEYKEQLGKIATLVAEDDASDKDKLKSKINKAVDVTNKMDVLQSQAKETTKDWLQKKLALQHISGESEASKIPEWIEKIRAHPKRFVYNHVGLVIQGHRQHPTLDMILKHNYLSKLPSKDTVIMGTMVMLSAAAIGVLTSMFMKKEGDE